MLAGHGLPRAWGRGADRPCAAASRRADARPGAKPAAKRGRAATPVQRQEATLTAPVKVSHSGSMCQPRMHDLRALA